MPPSRHRTTDTGWRLVGKATELVPDSRPVESVDERHCVFAARFTMRSWLGRNDPLPRALEIIGHAIAAVIPDAPPLTIDRPTLVPASRFEGLSWQVDGERTAFMGELWWRHAHPVLHRVPCTTHVVVTEVGQQVQLTVRVYADGGVDALSGLVGAGQSRPAWLSLLNRECRLSTAWGETAPVSLSEENMDGFVRDVLFADERRWPVVVVSMQEDGTYALSPEVIADELLGLARVYHLSSQNTSFRLTDLLGGKSLSCFWGAARVYLPQFSCADDPFDHPLFFPDELLDPASRAELAGELAEAMREVVPIAEGIAARRARVSRPRTHTPPHGTPLPPTPVVPPLPTAAPAATAEASPSVSAGASRPLDSSAAPLAGEGVLADAIGTVAVQLQALASAVSALAVANRDLFNEVAQLRSGNAVRLASIASIERRIERIDEFVRELPMRVQETAQYSHAMVDELATEFAEPRTDLVDIVRQASAQHSDALLVLESAESSAGDSPYEDVDRVAKVLDAMADIARRRQRGSLGMPLKQAFRDYGMDYRVSIAQSTSGKQRSQYLLTGPNGETFECLEHIVLGSSYDPRFCLRLYFTSRAPLEQRFVIGHVGRHFDVISST